MANEPLNGASLDSSLDLNALMAGDVVTTKKEEKPKKKLSPLEQAKLDRDSGKNQPGLEMSREEYESGLEKTHMVASEMVDVRTDAIKEYAKDQDKTLEKRKAIVVIKTAVGPGDYVKMMDEINAVEFDENGKAYFNFKKDVEDERADGTPYAYTVDDKEYVPEFIRLRTPDDPPFSMEADKELLEKAMAAKNEADNPRRESKEGTSEATAVTPETAEERVKKLATVLIDKTGLGVDWAFNEEERAKLETVDVIQVQSITPIDIKKIRVRRDNTVSFQQTINNSTLSHAYVNICLPASGFSCDMEALTYGELSDLTISMNGITVDRYRKRLSVIYKKMKNISIGQFKDFEDWLRHVSYTDVSLCMYAMYVATFPEISNIRLNCGNCNKEFDWKYNTRSILRLDRCPELMLSKMNELADAPGTKYDAIAANASVNNSSLFQLPESGLILEVGNISAYEFLYNFIPLSDEDTFKKAFGEDVSAAMLDQIWLILITHKVYVPIDGTDMNDGNGPEYNEYTDYENMLKAIFNRVKPSEEPILGSVMSKLTEGYQPVFSFGSVTCPHCGHVTDDVTTDMDTLLFRNLQLLSNTRVDVSKLQLS